jgi:hypothetical protein
MRARVFKVNFSLLGELNLRGMAAINNAKKENKLLVPCTHAVFGLRGL